MTYAFLGIGKDIISMQRKFDVVCLPHTDLKAKQRYFDHVKLHRAAMFVDNYFAWDYYQTQVDRKRKKT